MATAKTQKTAPSAVPAEEAPLSESVETTPPAAEPKTLLPMLSGAVEPVLQGVDELLDFSKENAEAVVAAGHRLAVGLQKMTHDLIELSQDTIEKNLATGKALASAASMQDLLELSQSAAKEGLDKILSEGSRLGAVSSKLVEETWAPLQSRVTAAIEKLTHRAA